MEKGEVDVCCMTIEVADTVRTMVFFFFNDTATTEIYTLSLHDALPILFSELTVLLN